MKKISPGDAKKVDAGVDGRIMYSGEKAEAIMLSLKPGEKIPEHTNPFDVLFIGLEGKVSVKSGREACFLTIGETLFLKGDKMRELSNNTEVPAHIMVVKIF